MDNNDFSIYLNSSERALPYVPVKLLTFSGKRLLKLLARYNVALLLIEVLNESRTDNALSQAAKDKFTNLKKKLKDSIAKLN